MLALGVFVLIIGGADVPLTANSAGIHVSSADTSGKLSVVAPLDTPRVRRRHAIEVSEWYGRRLTIHRAVAYATIPVFALQWAAGDQLYKKSSDAPGWAKTTHRAGATALAGMFTVNTVTGVWNWWDSRSTSDHRVLRTVHALTMLGADAAFTYAGAKLSNEAETSADKRREHRTVALSAMGVTVLSELAMKLFNK
jgi:hypothetical protein